MNLRWNDVSVKKNRIIIVCVSWKLNDKIFFELFLSDLDENMTSESYKRQKNDTL